MINKKWDEILNQEMKKEYFIKLGTFIKKEYQTKTIFPEYKNIFNALRYTDYDQVKVVILGQDPYHGIMKHMAYLFLLEKVLKCHHHLGIYSKN